MGPRLWSAEYRRTPRLFLIARALSAAAGIATVSVTYRVGVSLFDRTTGLVAALFLAIAALHVRESHFALTDVSATCLLMASFLRIVRYWRSGFRRDALLAAVLAGLAASTKYNAWHRHAAALLGHRFAQSFRWLDGSGALDDVMRRSDRVRVCRGDALCAARCLAPRGRAP